MRPRVVRVTVPRPLVWYVGRLEPADQQTYWRLCWHCSRMKRGVMAQRITILLLVPCLMAGVHWSAADPFVILTVGIVWTVLVHSTGVYWRSEQRHADRISAGDTGKWNDIGRGAEAILRAYRPGDPVERVAVTLPD